MAESASCGELIAERSPEISGVVRVGGDKSVSHRALMLAASAVGRSRVRGLLEAADVLATAAALRAMGVDIRRVARGEWEIAGLGVGGLQTPPGVLDCGNSGTSARLLAGLISSQPVCAAIVGDASLSRRPMDRIIGPLSGFGACFRAREGRYLPMYIEGARTPMPVTHRLQVPSAQVKSAVLFAALNTPGRTRVIEPVATRDHTERMLKALGAPLCVEQAPDGTREIILDGPVELAPFEIAVPADPSSAAFPIAAAVLAERGGVRLRDVMVNPTRSGFLETLAEMGARLRREGVREEGGEPVADLVVEAMGPGALEAVSPPVERVPRMIDEFPILFVLAATARGRSVFSGIGELRAKESDRIRAVAGPLAAMGVDVEEGEDSLAITGLGGPLPGGITVAAEHDHRIAMAFAVAGLAARAPIRITGAQSINTSFPDFVALMQRIGAGIRPIAAQGPDGAGSGREGED